MSALSGTTMDPRTASEGVTTVQSPTLSDMKWLDLSRSVIEYKEKKILAKALENNELPNLKVLFLEGNAGDVGMTAMLNALRAGHLKGLEKFILWEVSSYSQITTAEEGTDTIAAALLAGNLPVLDTMDFTGSLPKLITARKLSKAMTELLFRCSCGNGRLLEGLQICLGCLFCTPGPERNQALECLRCSCGGLQAYSGNDGIRKIAWALNRKPIDSLRVLTLQHNYIGDKGASSLAKLLRRGKLPHLEELDLRNNPLGYQGAKKMAFAYLRNPLLTVRLKLDWPTLLLQEKAVSFRDTNIRLEYRLKKLNIPPDSIAIDDFLEIKYQLKRHPGAGGFQRHTHRLHLWCQAQHGRRNFKSHEVVGEADLEPKGIEIRNRSIIGVSSRRKNVQRDLDLDDSDEEAEGQGWLSSGDETDESAVVGYPGHAASIAESGLTSTRSELPSVAPSEHALSADDMTVETLGEITDSVVRRSRGALFKRTPNRASMKKKKSVLKATTGVNRIYITSKSCGFVGAAKALGNQFEIGNSQQKRRWIPEWVHRKLRRRFWPWQSRGRTMQQMDSIRLELLMLGERKPDEFYSMFGLRQVLLQNRRLGNKYSRVWICETCFSGYSLSQAVHPITQAVTPITRAVHPITTDDEVGRKVPSPLDHLHQESEPSP